MQMSKLVQNSKFKVQNYKGFTLIELLVVITILGILSTIGLSSFRSSQAKGRDAKRKTDLGNIQKALEMYQNDYGLYPLTSSFPSWGAEFKDAKGTIYMKELPSDPVPSQNYVYKSNDGSWYKLYARLENGNDLCFTNQPDNCKSAGFSGTDCGGGALCNYGVSSSNVNP